MSGYLVRHGNTVVDKAGLTRGTSNDINLDVKGVKQANVAGRILKSKSVTSLKSSDRKHTKQTANVIGLYLRIRNKPLASLRSLNLGKFTGGEADKIDPMITKWIIEEPKKCIPGGECPYNWIFDLWPEIKLFLEGIEEGLTPVIVTHGRPLNVIRAAVEGNGQFLSKKILESYPTEKHGCVYRVDFDGEKFSIHGPILE